MKIFYFLKSFLGFIADERCVVCDKNKGFICSSCEPLLPLNKIFCDICASPLNVSTDNLRCGKCLNLKPVYQSVFSPLIYDGFLREIIIEAKFKGKFQYYTMLMNKVYDIFQKNFTELGSSAKAIIPIPLSKQRLRERGYNQSMLIARFLSKKLNIPILSDSLIKVRHTIPQSMLGEKDRIKNIKGAFLLKKSLKTDKIILVDDIITSGATINEASLALKKGGVNEIRVFSLCRATF